MQTRIRQHVFGLIVLLGLAACQVPMNRTTPAGAPRELPLSGPVAGVAGRLLYANGAQFRTFEISTGAVATLATFPGNVVADAPAVSPDGSLIAFSMYRPDSDAVDATGGVDLMVMNVDGSGQRVLLAHTRPNESYSEPAWAPDGRTLFFTFRGLDDPPRIERIGVDGTGRAVVVARGRSPSVSADNSRLAFLVDDQSSGYEVLAVANAEGGDVRPLFTGGTYQVLAAPRFAPNSQRIVFSGVTEIPQPEGRIPFRLDPLAALRPRTAAAHGVPWDIWIINADGSGRERLTELEEDAPMATWSADGSHLAIKGELGLYLLELSTKKLHRMAQELAGDGLDWIEP